MPTDYITAEQPLTLSDFDYPFPQELVAQAPCAERDGARLLVRPRSGILKEAHISDLPSELASGTVLILNASRVFPSRIIGHLASGGQVELFLLRPLEADGPDSCTWRAMGRPMKKLLVGRTITLAGDVAATIVAKADDGVGNAFVTLSFNLGARALAAWLERHGQVPLPPYIKRPRHGDTQAAADRDRYQTVYAQEVGSVAAPTAGLHFTAELLERLRSSGVEVHYVALHVGAGTFLPVKTDDPALHKMHAEPYRVGRATAQAVVAAKAAGRPVVAVGTTALRSLEDLYRRTRGNTAAFIEQADAWHSTELYIHPRTASDVYKPWVIDGLMTNFHQPCSTLFMLISALLGLVEAKAVYAAAIERRFRLYSYGDSSLLWL